jgi:hypothetical protein
MYSTKNFFSLVNIEGLADMGILFFVRAHITALRHCVNWVGRNAVTSEASPTHQPLESILKSETWERL